MTESFRTIEMQQLRRYKAGGYDLVPLNKWDYETETPKGKVARGKTPRDANWLVREYKGTDLKDWIKEGGNIGVRLRACDLVVDFDPRNVPKGSDPILDLELEFGLRLDDYPHVKTGGGGDHWYMRIPEGVRVKNTLPQFPGVEFKALGRQVVAAGSIHPNGQNYLWTNAVEETPKAPEALLLAIQKPLRSEVQGVAGEISVEDLSYCLDQLNPRNFRAHDIWFELMTACHSATNGTGLDVFMAWSMMDPEYAHAGEMIAYRWNSLTANEPGGVKLGTLYMHVLDADGQLPRPKLEEVFQPFEAPAGVRELRAPNMVRNQLGVPKPTVANAIEALKAMEPGLQYDCIRNQRQMLDAYWLRTMYKTANENVDGRTLSMLQGFFIKAFGLELSPSKIGEAVDTLTLANIVNPLAIWLDGLVWDGTPRLDTWLTRYAGAENNAYTRAVGRATLLGAVARVYEPGIKFDTMLILEGPQGTFKSTIVKILGGDYYMAGLPNKELGDKDIIAALAGKWIIEIEELSTMRRSDAESFKGFLSKQTDTGRLPYKPLAEDFPRRCIFIGTTNPNGSGYLRDSTGNRRFFPVAVGKADPDALLVERDQLFAEATMQWKADPTEFALLIPKALWNDAAEEQEMRRTEDPWEVAFQDYMAKLGDDVRRISSTELWFNVMKRGTTDATPDQWKRMGAAMARLGWEATNKVPTNEGKYVRGYKRVS